MLPRRNWSLLDRDALNWLVGEDKPDRKLLPAVSRRKVGAGRRNGRPGCSRCVRKT
jgi:hypothetical protein